MNKKIILTADDLFGNDASEDEVKEVFESYALLDDRVTHFSQGEKRVAVARAYKGEGKSAVLRLLGRGDDMVCSLKASTISPKISGTDTDEWVRAWKKAIIDLVGAELGKRIGMAWTGDSIALVELAERSGLRSKNIVGTLLERVDEFFGVKLKEAEGKDHSLAVVNQLRGKPFWIVLDDADQNFQNTPENKAKLASLFIAVREVVNSIDDLRIRLTIRPNIWAILKPEFEGLSHVEQYMYDLRTDVDRMRKLLARRVEGYLKRHGLPLPGVSSDERRDQVLIAMVFEKEMLWGGESRPPHIVLHTLCRHRPRWLVQLCKLAGKRAEFYGHEKISLSDISDCLYDFGDARITDVIAEFRSQCPEVGDLIGCFARQKEEWRTDELLQFINERILQNISPTISGVIGRPGSLDVAAFLYEIGFLSARKDLDSGEYQHYAFAEKPGLLRSKASVDEGVVWEIHPVFRQRLGMRDVSGKIYQQKTPERGRKRYVRNNKVR